MNLIFAFRRLYGGKGLIQIMVYSFKRVCAILLSFALLGLVALGASAAAVRTTTVKMNVGVQFWKADSDKESMANSGVDAERDAILTRQTNGTYTLALPIKQVSKMGITGALSGLTIGDVAYDGELSGELNEGTAVLTIKNLPASVLTGSDVSKALSVTCNIQMDLSLLGELNTSARMCIWNKG